MLACEQGVDMEARDNRDNSGRTPLQRAARHGYLPVVQYLCEQGPNRERLYGN
jgi:ankyrin repeat protein